MPLGQPALKAHLISSHLISSHLISSQPHQECEVVDQVAKRETSDHPGAVVSTAVRQQHGNFEQVRFYTL